MEHDSTPSIEAQASCEVPGVSERVSRMHGATGFIWDDEDAFLGSLRGMPAGLAPAVDACHRERYGNTAADEIANTLGGSQLAEAEALIADDPTGAQVARLIAAQGPRDPFAQTPQVLVADQDEIVATIEALETDEARAEFVQRYQAEQGEPLDELFARTLEGEQRTRVQALMEGDSGTVAALDFVDALHTGWLGLGVDVEGALEVLEEAGPGFEAAVVAMTGIGVDGHLERLPDEGNARAQALRSGDVVGAEIIEVGAQLGDVRFRDDGGVAMCDLLGTLPDREAREAAIALHDESSVHEWAEIDHALDQADTPDGEMLRACVETGEVPPAYRAIAAGAGWGTNEAELERAFAGLTAAEARDLDADLVDHVGMTADAYIASETSGALRHELLEDARGIPETLADQAAAQQRDYEFYRGDGATSFSRFWTDHVAGSPDGPLADAAAVELQALLAAGAAEPSAAPELRAQLVAMIGHSMAYNDEYVTDRDRATDVVVPLVTSAGGLAAAGVCTAVTLGGCSPMIPAAAGVGAGMLTTAAMQGDSYGHEQVLSDLARGSVDILAPGIARQLAVPRGGEALGILAQARDVGTASLTEALVRAPLQLGVSAIDGGPGAVDAFTSMPGGFASSLTRTLLGGPSWSQAVTAGALGATADGVVDLSLGVGPEGAGTYEDTMARLAFAATRGGFGGIQRSLTPRSPEE